MSRAPQTPCPVCEFKLRGSAQEGYRCVKCHSHFGTSFVRKIRRKDFGKLIEKHFSPAQAVQEIEQQLPPLHTTTVVQETSSDFVHLGELVRDVEPHIAKDDLFVKPPRQEHFYSLDDINRHLQ